MFCVRLKNTVIETSVMWKVHVEEGCLRGKNEINESWMSFQVNGWKGCPSTSRTEKLTEIVKKCLAKDRTFGCKKKWIHCIGPEFQESGPWYLLYDNAWMHSSGTLSKILGIFLAIGFIAWKMSILCRSRRGLYWDTLIINTFHLFEFFLWLQFGNLIVTLCIWGPIQGNGVSER